MTSVSWLNTNEIVALIEKWDDAKVKKLTEAMNLSQIVSGCLFDKDSQEYEGLVHTVACSAQGLELLDAAGLLTDAPSIMQRIALFQTFNHHDLLFDLDEFSTEQFIANLSVMVRKGHVRLPDRFGRTLYDKFASAIELRRQDFLSGTETLALLQGSEQGVYQLGNFLTGPVGVIAVKQARFAPPSHSVPLWHCEDAGCNNLHQVRLTEQNSELRQIGLSIASAALSQFGSPSRWHTVVSLLEEDEYPDSYGDILTCVQECFTLTESRSLLTYLLSSSSGKGEVWSLMGNHKLVGKSVGSPELVVGRLTHKTLVQLILNFDDTEIVEAIDHLVLIGDIKVPPEEVRISKQGQPTRAATRSKCAISSLGIRSNAGNPVTESALAIWTAYDDADRLPDLAWKTARTTGYATPGDVISYLSRNTLGQAISELVLSNREVAIDVCRHVGLSISALDSNSDVISRMMWKLGFDVPRFGEEYRTLIRLLTNFRDTLLKMEGTLSQHDREAVRGVGANLFAELEGFLETLVSYNVWLLQSDHFVNSFIYNPRDATTKVGLTIDGNTEAVWKSTGGNALGVILAYLSASADWMEALVADGTTPQKRPSQQYPHFADEDDDLFPFHHHAFWADADTLELDRYARTYRDIVALLLRSNLAAVRNGIDHFRRPDDFPTVEAMLACESRIRQAVETAVLKRIYPTRWWMADRQTSDIGLITEKFRNENGEVLNVLYPSALRGIGEANYGEAVVIPHGNLLGQPNSTIVLTVQENSGYQELWSDYPSRLSARKALDLGSRPVASDPEQAVVVD